MCGIFCKQKQRGFTLIEVVMSLAIFLIIMTATSGIFASIFSGYRNTRAIQHDVETAQYALGIMAKELRTSSIAASTGTSVRFYDYSQDVCFSYRISGGELQSAKVRPANPSVLTTALMKINFCQTAGLSSYETISTGTVTGNFVVTPSTTGPISVGRVTVALQIAEGVSHTANIQTSMSLRDYNFTGL